MRCVDVVCEMCVFGSGRGGGERIGFGLNQSCRNSGRCVCVTVVLGGLCQGPGRVVLCLVCCEPELFV